MDGRISNFDQVASVRRYTITEGRERGFDVLDCDNGTLRFLLNLSRACDIMQLYHEGANVSFVSKNGFTSRETPFAKRFEGGMLYTCGLDNIGAREGYEMHGTLHNIPAHLTSAVCDERGIRVEAEIRDTALFGKNLVLRRRITSAVGSGALTLEDTLVNEGYRDEKYCILYHINIGYPMLDVGAVIEADVESCVPRTEWARVCEAERFRMGEPVPNKEECCYFLKLGEPRISLVNKPLGKRLTVNYSGDTLPYFVEWKSEGSGDYALGFEPTTTEIDNGFKYSIIGCGESVSLDVKISVEKI